MGRLNQPSTATDPYYTGQLCYRQPGEVNDGRPLLNPGRFWDSVEQEATYLLAVRNNPIKAGEPAFAYVRRVAHIASEEPLAAVAKPMPKRWQEPARASRVQAEPGYEERLQTLFADREPGEEG